VETQRTLWNGTTRSAEVETSIDGLTVRVTMSAIYFRLNQS
jgi:hypothetical protein